MTLANFRATQLSTTHVELSWDFDGFVAGTDTFDLFSNEPPVPPVLGTFIARDVTVLSFVDVPSERDPSLGVGSTLQYLVQHVQNPTDTQQIVGFVLADLDTPPTFGPVDPLQDQPRYTTLEAVKQRLAIDHAQYDDALTQAIVAAETAIDQQLGRSFGDTGDNPEVPGVPQAIRYWALDASIAVWKLADAPFDTLGSDPFLGTLDVRGEVEQVMRRHPLAIGYKVSWGIA